MSALNAILIQLLYILPRTWLPSVEGVGRKLLDQILNGNPLGKVRFYI
jgi:hypothetical protein